MSNDFRFYERQMLEYWLRTKMSLRDIAKIMRRTHGALSKEITKNGSGDRKRYRADTAQWMFERRQHKQRRGKLDKYPQLKQTVIEGLVKEWSPDVIAGKLKESGHKQM